MLLRDAIIEFILVQLALIAGFCFGRITNKTHITTLESSRIVPKKFDFNPEEKKQKIHVSIDDSVYVTSTSSSDLQKSNNDIGKTTTVEDNIESSVSKLAHLKKNR